MSHNETTDLLKSRCHGCGDIVDVWHLNRVTERADSGRIVEVRRLCADCHDEWLKEHGLPPTHPAHPGR